MDRLSVHMVETSRNLWRGSVFRLGKRCLARRHLSLSVYGDSREIPESIRAYAQKRSTPGSIQQMIAMSKPKNRTTYAPIVHNELLVRIAHRFRDFQSLPGSLRETKAVSRVASLYLDYFTQLMEQETPDNPSADRDFVRVISEFKARDSATLPLIAAGIKEWQSKHGSETINAELAAQLDDIFTARLSIRMLIGQYSEFDEDLYGRIQRGLRVEEVIKEAAGRASKMCLAQFGACPDILVEGNVDFKLTYVKSHLHHMMFELLKNSARAVVEQHIGEQGAERRKRLTLSHGHLGSYGLPPIIVVIAGGKEDAIIKVSDEGGGIPRSGLSKIWSYQYTTADVPLNNDLSTVETRSFRDEFYGYVSCSA